MFLTVREAAALLRASERQVHRWVGEAEIPFQRVRDQVRFNRTDLLEWATRRRLPVSLEAFDASIDPDDTAPSLADALRRGAVHVGVPSADRDATLRAVVDCTPMPEGLDRELVTEVLVAREHALSTAIGHGIAIPHVRQPVVAPGASPTVSVSYLRAPVEFGAPDGEPVHTVFLIISPTVKTHLQMLAHVARVLLDPAFQSALTRRAATEELVTLAERIERAPEDTVSSNPKMESH